jgi:RND superfamily putative drug exporter
VITSAGIIFAASMSGLLFGSLSTMVQTGFIIGMGILIDTFVVRTITVPALAALVGRANWWPAKPFRTKAPAVVVPVRPAPACVHGDVPHARVVGDVRRSAAYRRRALARTDLSGGRRQSRALVASSLGAPGTVSARKPGPQRDGRPRRLSVAANSCSGRPVVP